MKRLIALSSLLVLLCVTSAGAQTVKIGTVNMDKIFKGYYRTKDAKAHMRELQNSVKAEMDDRMATYKQTLDEYSKLNDELKNGGGLSEAKKAEKSKTLDEKRAELDTMQREIKEFDAQREKDLQDQVVRMRNEIVEEIMNVIKDKIKTDNYDYVFDKSAPSLNGLPFLVFSRDTVDFSDDIITSLNKNKKETPIAPSSATPAASPKATPRLNLQP